MSRADKIRRLRDDPAATDGERQAAQAALDRLGDTTPQGETWQPMGFRGPGTSARFQGPGVHVVWIDEQIFTNPPSAAVSDAVSAQALNDLFNRFLRGE